MTPNRRLKQARELRGWSQAKVAEHIGTDATTVSRWERGLFSPTPYFREKLCTLFSKNAAELGLLETRDQPQASNESGPSLQSPAPVSSLQASKEWRREDLDAGNIIPPIPPSWPKRADTFTYILQSATHDQQAHLLWEDAYVRALHGQGTEARQLGEASLSAFESVGHLNAMAIREWLNQRGLVPPSPPPASAPPTPLPVRPEQDKRAAKQILRAGGAGIALNLIIVAALLLSGFSFSQLYPTALTSPVAAHASSSEKIEAPAKPSPGLTGNATATPVISVALTPVISSTRIPMVSSDLTVKIVPSYLTPRDCYLEPLGYRCELKLWLATTGQGPFTWHASNTNLLVTFNPANGTSTSGQPSQVIVYIQSSSGEKGQMVFTFTSSTGTSSAIVTWQG
ncbi:MAG TPA: helix-turn-helix transcriptional regulator [Ktedonosporobacter sp.]|nr:helix-turn-helix transcriptional regulator [Ktedonosporobacter sp.]